MATQQYLYATHTYHHQQEYKILVDENMTVLYLKIIFKSKTQETYMRTQCFRNKGIIDKIKSGHYFFHLDDTTRSLLLRIYSHLNPFIKMHELTEKEPYEI